MKPVVVSLKPEILTKSKFSGFNEIHQGVSSFYPQITRETANFRSTEFHWIPCQKLKKIWACFLWNPTYGDIWPKLGHFMVLKLVQKKKNPQKSRETTQSQGWFQIKKFETILKPSWFHKKRPSSRYRPKIGIFRVKN